jgi:hypothetical protein
MMKLLFLSRKTANRIANSFTILSFLLIHIPALAQLQPVGRWREHLEYKSGLRVTSSNEKIFVAGRLGIFSVSRQEGEIERYNKVTGLSDIGIRSIKYDRSSEKLLIAYNNSNIDVLYRNDVINIPYVLRSNVSGDKNLYNIFFYRDKAYLSSGLGVIVADLNKYEISNTYIIGNNGANVKVNSFAADATKFYAATDEGLKTATQNAANLNDYRNWTLMSGTNGLPAGAAKEVMVMNNQLFVQIQNTLYLLNGTNWQLVYTDSWRWENVNAADGNILICEEQNGWDLRRVVMLNTAGTVVRTVENNTRIRYPFQAEKTGNEIWIADFDNTLVKAEGSSFIQYKVNSPYGPLDGEMIFYKNTLYVAGGSINDAWNYTYNGTGFFTYKDDTWTAYNRQNISWMDSVLDIITIAVDPRDDKVYAGSFGGGLVEFESPVKYKLYKQNSPLNVATGDPNNYRVGGLAFDADNHLWISNFAGANNFLVKKADGNWKQFRVPFFISDNMVGAIVIDDANQKWIQVPQGNGIYVFNHGESIDNTGDDRWKWFQSGRGNGNLPSNVVNCLVKDKDGFIWIGTDRGIGIVQCPGEVFTANGCETFQPVVQNDNFAGLLFQNENVKTIAVDGANRKWIGTNNGVWLISADGEKVIERFTAENSPLLSNNIIRISIEPASGEVFFSTFNGICSYRGSATEGTEKNENVLVFPNPVPPAYNGTIAIRGLANNSIVKITELNGRLVHQTRALGGQAVWNGRDYNNQRVASGVYLVLATNETGEEKIVTKIVFIK